MKKLLLTCLFATHFLLSKAQVQFEKTYGNPASYDEFYGVCQTADSGYAFLGNTFNTVDSVTNLLLVKTNSSGDVIWSKSYSYTIDVFSTKIAVDANGNFYLIGYTYENNAPFDDAFVIKTDSAGTMLWSNRYGGTDIDEVNDAVLDNNGDLVLAGYTYSFGTTLKSSYAIKIDNAGSIVWSKTFSQNANQEFNGVSVADNNDYIFTGLTQRPPGINFDGYIVRTDASGNMLWGQSCGGTGTETFYHSRVSTNGSIQVSAASSTGTASGNLDGAFVVFNPTGGHISANTYGTAAVDRTYSISAGKPGSNSVVLSGHTTNAAGFEVPLLLFVNENSNAVQGQILSGGNDGGSRAFRMLTTDQDIVQVGFKFGAIDTLGSAYTMKYIYDYVTCTGETVTISDGQPTFTDSLGTTDATAQTTGSTIAFIENNFNSSEELLCLNVGIKNQQMRNAITLSPNPAADNLLLSIDDNIQGNSIVRIIDMTGKIIRTITSQERIISVPITDMHEGIYTIQVINQNRVYTTKLEKSISQ